MEHLRLLSQKNVIYGRSLALETSEAI